MGSRKPRTTATAALAFIDLFGEMAGDTRVPPTEFRLFSYGVNRSDQGEFIFDQESAASVMAEYARQARDIVIDYEHQSMTGGKALAAGWFVPEVRADGLWATSVRWTNEARQEIAQAQYRYFSPTFDYERKTGRITILRNAALTNNPSLYGLPALVAASSRPRLDDDEEEDDMEPKDLEKLNGRITELERANAAKDEEIARLKSETHTVQLSATVGLAAGARPEQLHAAVTSLATLRSKVRDLTGHDSVDAAIGKIEAWKQEATEVAGLRSKVESLETGTYTSAIKTTLDKACEAGRVLPAEREIYERKALSYGGGRPSKEGAEWLDGFVTDLPVKVSGVPASGGAGTAAGGGALPKPVPGSGLAVLSQHGVELARMNGDDPVKVAEFVAKEIAAGRLT